MGRGVLVVRGGEGGKGVPDSVAKRTVAEAADGGRGVGEGMLGG